MWLDFVFNIPDLWSLVSMIKTFHCDKKIIIKILLLCQQWKVFMGAGDQFHFFNTYLDKLNHMKCKI